MEELYTLVETAQTGNRAAYELLMSRFQGMAYAIAYRYVGDYTLAQDVVQNALIEAYLHLPELKEPEAFPGWFRQIVFHQCHRLLRQPTLECLSLDVITSRATEAHSPQDIVERHEIQGAVQQAITMLPSSEQQIVTLFYLSGYSQQEISHMLHLPVNIIKKRLYYARKRLKQQLASFVEGAIADIGIAMQDETGSAIIDSVIIFLRFVRQGVINQAPTQLQYGVLCG